MNRTRLVLTIGGAFIASITTGVQAQTVLFDFDNAPVHTSLPVDVSAGGLTAHLSATGQGFSIQPAGALGFTPVGFSGLCIYPNSVFAADLLIGFSTPVTAFSILYSTQELACDDAARMRVTAYLGNAPVGTATTTANCADGCTWPSQTLSYSNPQGFDRVVVHYDARPPTCQDYGVIFMADNMQVTPRAAACPADFNGSGAVTVQDIFDYLGAYFAGSFSADVNHSGSVSVQDVFDFLALYFAGCA